jgi:hypothetical protein
MGPFTCELSACMDVVREAEAEADIEAEADTWFAEVAASTSAFSSLVIIQRVSAVDL